jgi:hypothetical protein
VAISPLDACVTPALTQGANGLITLTNVTAGANIYYSVAAPGDCAAVFPAPQVPSAKLYAAPFSVASGTDVRWAAYADCLAGSHAGFQTIIF